MITKPTVHLNGTSQGELLSGFVDAYSAVSAALRSLEINSPNARDYYVQGPNSFNKAMTEHGERLRKLIEVKHELMELCESIQDQRKR